MFKNIPLLPDTRRFVQDSTARHFPANHIIFPVDIHCSSMYRTIMLTKDLVAASSRPIVLSIIAGGESYGYEIIQKVRELSGGHIEWSDGMLYPVLHRLEREGLIASEWKE